jgi:ribonuclease Y
MMEAMIVGISGLSGVVLGGGAGYGLHKYFRTYTLRKAKQEAQDILAEAKDQIELRALEE